MRPVKLQKLQGGTVTLHNARRQLHRTVTLQPFEIGVCSVTQEQLAQLHDLQPVYAVSDHVTWDVTANGYRLPTEAEWEFACRAGSDSPHYGPLAKVAWTHADGVEAPQHVGRKAPNAYGLYDTLGNIWEWCWDRLDPARYGDYRVFRGGGFADKAWSVRASVRRGGAPDMQHPDVGFRFARGGFEAGTAAQGWSALADQQRATQRGPLPTGWTPLVLSDPSAF